MDGFGLSSGEGRYLFMPWPSRGGSRGAVGRGGRSLRQVAPGERCSLLLGVRPAGRREALPSGS